MAHDKIEFLSAVLLVSKDAERLATFYRDVLALPLKVERPEGTLAPHYRCQLGDLHFSIHSVMDFPDETRVGSGSVRLALAIFDMDAFLSRLSRSGIEPLYPPRDLKWCRMTALRDPDGNYLEFTQLSDGWYEQLADRKRKGFDVVLRWQAARALEKDRGHT
jgi:uncharacterized glyoxalase superfamily protein PhnB